MIEIIQIKKRVLEERVLFLLKSRQTRTAPQSDSIKLALQPYSGLSIIILY